jgi:hypothetical protein
MHLVCVIKKSRDVNKWENILKENVKRRKQRDTEDEIFEFDSSTLRLNL